MSKSVWVFRLGILALVATMGFVVWLANKSTAFDRLSDKLPPGAKHVEYTDADGQNSSVVFDLGTRRFLMWYSKNGGAMVVEVSK